MPKRLGALVALPVMFVVGAGCGSGSSEPTGSSKLAAGSGSSPAMSKTIESEYGMTVFGGSGDCQSLACGGGNSCSSQPWYSASSQRYGCGVHLQVTANGKCVVVQTEDAGPASWVESNAGIAILDSGPQVAQYLFGTSSIGWSDIKNNPGKYVVKVSTTTAGLGPCGASSDAGGGGGSAGAGGSAGSGGSDGSGGSAGSGGGGSGGSGGGGSKGSKGGSGGSGGSSGTGGGKDAGGGDAYAFFERHEGDRHHVVSLASTPSRTVPFRWHEASGAAPAVDLAVVVGGRLLLQVTSVDGQPFARAGLDVIPLDPAASYRLVLDRTSGSVRASVHSDDGAIGLTSTPPPAGEGADAVEADVVLPGAGWRTSIATDLP